MSEPFGFEIKRPGESLFPEDWALILPHQCGEWVIEECDLDTVIASAKRFRAELDTAIAELEKAAEATAAPDLWDASQFKVGEQVRPIEGATMALQPPQTVLAVYQGPGDTGTWLWLVDDNGIVGSFAAEFWVRVLTGGDGQQ